MKKLALVLLFWFPALSEAQLVRECPVFSDLVDMGMHIDCPIVFNHEGYKIYIDPAVEQAFEENPDLVMKAFLNFIEDFDQVFVPGKLNNSPADFMVEGEINWLQNLSISPWIREPYFCVWRTTTQDGVQTTTRFCYEDQPIPDQLGFYLYWGRDAGKHGPCGGGGPRSHAYYCGGNNPAIASDLWSRLFPSLPAWKTTLIHEFVHFQHDKILPQGFDNICVKEIYEIYISRYPDSEAYWTTNHLEFLAEAAETYYGEPTALGPGYNFIDNNGNYSFSAGYNEELQRNHPEAYDLVYFLIDHYDSEWELVEQHCGETT